MGEWLEGEGGRGLRLGAAITAQNHVLLREEADAHQRRGAAGAGETGMVPVAFPEGHKLPFPETCSGDREAEDRSRRMGVVKRALL